MGMSHSLVLDTTRAARASICALCILILFNLSVLYIKQYAIMIAMVTSMFNTNFGQYALSSRPGNPVVVFLSGADAFSTAQTFSPIIDALPKKIGFLTIDYLFSGLSSPATGNYNYGDSLDDIEKIISTRTSGSIILVAHSIGGLYALELFNRLRHMAAFVGIEPTTREIINHPPKTQAYIDVSKQFDDLGPEGAVRYIHSKLELCFPAKQADLIWQTAKASEKANAAFTDQYDYFSNSFDWHSSSKLDKIPSIIFTEAYRQEEYLRSEFMTDNLISQVIPLGDFHYIHWEEAASIANVLNKLICDQYLSV